MVSVSVNSYLYQNISLREFDIIRGHDVCQWPSVQLAAKRSYHHHGTTPIKLILHSCAMCCYAVLQHILDILSDLDFWQKSKPLTAQKGFACVVCDQYQDLIEVLHSITLLTPKDGLTLQYFWSMAENGQKWPSKLPQHALAVNTISWAITQEYQNTSTVTV